MKIYEYIFLGDLEGVKKLVEEECIDIDSVDLDNCTLLHHAASAGRGYILKYLLEQGANPTLRDDFGNVPLDYLKGDRDQDLIKCLKFAEDKFRGRLSQINNGSKTIGKQEQNNPDTFFSPTQATPVRRGLESEQTSDNEQFSIPSHGSR